MLGDKTQARLAEILIVVTFLVCAETMALPSALTAQRQRRVRPLLPERRQPGRCPRTPGAVAMFPTATREMNDRQTDDTEMTGFHLTMSLKKEQELTF